MSIDEKKEKLNNQIWTTRTSRINAEKRLKETEMFIEGINIYYSCFTVIVSLILLITQNYVLNITVLAMTIVLTISFLFFKSLSYTERAQAYRQNYTEMQKLEFELSHDISDEQIRDIETRYCELLLECENHISYDYYKTLHYSNGSFRKNHYNCNIRCKYYWNRVWRISLKIISIILPFAVVLFAHWGQLNGWITSI